MTYAKRVDVNQKEIVKALRDCGASVVDLSKVGHGVPDLLVGYSGLTVLVEVKSSEKAKFTDDQLEFMKRWYGGALVRINDVEGAIRLVNLIDAETDTDDQ